MENESLDKIFFICNPTAGAGLASERWPEIYEELIDNKIDFDYQFTTSPQNAIQVTHDIIKKGYRRIGVFGGDGTVNEILQGVMQNKQFINFML